MPTDMRTVKELRGIAKLRGLKRYSTLRKDELVSLITSSDRTPVIRREPNLLDSPLPDIQVETFVPTKYLPPPQTSAFKSVLGDLKNLLGGLKKNIRSEFNSFSNWLVSYIPPQTKKA